MHDTIRRLQQQARDVARGKAPTAIRYPAGFRREAVAVARRLRSQHGRPMVRIARDLGVPPRTLGIWLRHTPRSVRPVFVAATAPEMKGTGPVLVTVQGHRVEGLDIETLVRVLRSIS